MPTQPNDPILLYLWQRRTLYLGELPPVPDLTPAATTLLMGMEKPFLIRDYASGHEVMTRSALIPAGTRFGADPLNQNMVNCYLDPLGQDLIYLRPQMQHQLGKILIDSKLEPKLLHQFQSIFNEELAPEIAYQNLALNIFANEQANQQSEAQQKIIKVIELIRGDPLSNKPADALAQQAGLSTSQMNRWFKRFTGVPVRRYRLWHRLFVTANLMAFGKTLTEAAHTAGFSDSSHLNHTFRSMLGMAPSFVFQRSDRLRIFSSNREK